MQRRHLLNPTIPLLPRAPGGARSKTTKSNAAWLSRQNRDQFVKQRAGTFRSRSAFKLLELDAKFRFLRRGQVVVDLGAAPGGWSEAVLSRLSGPAKEETPSLSAKIIAVDLLPIIPIPGVDIIQGDFLSPVTQAKLAALLNADSGSRGLVDVVVSDMCHNISGNRIRDVESSLELCSAAFEFARVHLRGVGAGALVMKHFAHPILDAFRKERLELSFRKVHYSKPQASRGESSEGYWVCVGWKGSSL
ncbi:hypothetical protein BOTBODRAFT_103069 [Botryobasidium botryosum FD-172 SS1]|uniref:rRNA methyltransferase 2, mitochondrial n=1 Tax=Botryobasidium botryosum (strain FD-172 SS1) TaxID=930990 RepID=A0A067MVQ6_BOTB1|nr:hypothetical protein BOTBODRAFT_103069 [Botryobasidium botryosum FD-172 SS1]